ncbi:hypothetical protein [Streptomyces smyrnaeus]|uniref:hypothetical protein n=1 Tax=Streptomyces smyrnaeus TaxID=1387713 RepID=UPI0036805F74
MHEAQQTAQDGEESQAANNPSGAAKQRADGYGGGGLGAEPRVSVEQRFARNDGVAIGVQIVQEIHRLRGDLLPADWITQRLATYERPEHEQEELHGILVRDHVLVLHAEEHTGRYTAALNALHRLVGTRIRQVRREPGDVFSIEGLRESNTGWILDLRDDGDKLPSGIGPALTEDAPSLRHSGSYLVVLADTDAWERAAKGTTVLAHALQAPAPQTVLRAHLEKTVPSVAADRWLAESQITEGIEDLLPADVVEWSHIIRETEALEKETGQTFGELVEHVVAAAEEDWRTRLMKWHTEHHDSTHRNYLLAAAVLDGAPVETVYAAADTLAKALGEDPAPHPGQQGLGVIALTDAIDADLTDEDTVAFWRPRFAEAVVDYFWADRPHLIKSFTRWTAEQTNNKDLPEDVTSELVGRVTGWALEYMRRKRTTKLLREIAGQWAEALPEQARDLLIAAVLDPETSRRARDAYRTWAQRSDADVPPHLKTALAHACARLAEVYPSTMLRRLTELAAHTESEEVYSAVGEALNVLWDQPRQQQAIQDRLAEWASGTHEGRRAAAHHAFVHLAARTTPDGRPVLLATDAGGSHHAWHAARWRGLLDNTTEHLQAPLQKALTIWMDAATAHPDLRETVLVTLQHAIYQPHTDAVYAADRYLALSHLLYSWAPVQSQHLPTAPEQLRDELILALRRADPAAPMPESHAPVD